MALLCSGFRASAQKAVNPGITITGVVADSLSGKTIEYPTVAIFTDSLKLIKAVAGGADGKFTIEAPGEGKYILSASMIGYSNSKNSLLLEGGIKKYDAGTIKLLEGMQLKEVTVVAVKPLIKNEPDKLTYNLESDPQTSSSALVDILRKVPMLSVDGEDVVRLNGETNFKVLVNGRSSGLLVKNFKDAIKSMPASSIKSIEVITNPPAKYDAEGIGGIINIITNRKDNQGYSGSLNAGASTLGGFNGGGYISAQLGKFSLSTNLYAGNYVSKKNRSISESENYLSDQFKYSNSETTGENKGTSYNASVEASYEIDSLNLLTLSFWGYFGDNTSTGTSDFVSYDKDHIMSRKYSNITTSTSQYGWSSGSVSYQKTFKKPDQNLTFSYNIDASPMNSDIINTIDPEFNYASYTKHSINTATGLDHTIQADYYDPLTKKHFIETGVKYILRQNTSDTKVKIYDDATGTWIDDQSRVNDLDYDQHIGSMYGGYVFKHKSLTAKAGFRMEYTLNDGISKSHDGNVTFTNKQFDVVPYINLSYMLKKGNSVTASFTQRLNRPGIWYLNPYVNDTDPMNISYGNPNLETVRRNSVTLGYRKASQKWNLNLSLNGNSTKNNIERIRRVGENGVSVSTYENIGINRNLRLNFSYSYRMGEKFSIYLNGSTGYATISSAELGLTNDGFSFNGGLGGSAGLWKKGYFNFNAYVYGGDISLQSRYPVNYMTSFGFSQRFLKDKLTFSVYISEPFTKTKKFIYDSQDVTYKMHSENISYRRSASFSLYWRFGKFNVNVKKARKSSVDDKMSGGTQGGTTTP